MWRVVYIAATPSLAKRLQGLLTEQGFLVSLRQHGAEMEGGCAVLVPAVEARAAQEELGRLLSQLRVGGDGPAGEARPERGRGPTAGERP